MIGARDMAFPRLNALSYWLLLFGGIVLYALAVLHAARGRLVLLHAAVARRSTRRPAARTRGSTWSTSPASPRSLGAINFYATIANMRAPGMGWGRLPLFVWTMLIYACC